MVLASTTTESLEVTISQHFQTSCVEILRPIKACNTLSVDASQHGLSTACLQNGMPIIAYASRTLTETEKHHAQIEKELLAGFFAAMKFHDFIYGHDATIETDHKTLITICEEASLCSTSMPIAHAL